MSVPASLRKRGIQRVQSNRRPDERVVLPAGLIVGLFGEELSARLAERQGRTEPAAPAPEKKRRVLCPPKGNCR